jgi:bifunctional DNase/RNase
VSDTRVKVWKVLYDPETSASVVLLQNESEDRVLPIWVGQSEALSIAMASEGIKLPRPMTHDLIKTVILELSGELEWIRIHDLREGTFFATLRISSSDRKVDLDTRPSDGIALALRMDAPIFISERVFQEAVRTDLDISHKLDNLEEDFLANLPDEFFGKYKM